MTVSDTFTCTMEAEMWVFGALNTKVVPRAKKIESQDGIEAEYCNCCMMMKLLNTALPKSVSKIKQICPFSMTP